ncbi:MAG: FAD-dependent monooxygenase [Gammaproteobacteria bacterium]|nr:FAD-dependent monooxygenase [Gammaproteobacteria bacterium]
MVDTNGTPNVRLAASTATGVEHQARVAVARTDVAVLGDGLVARLAALGLACVGVRTTLVQPLDAVDAPSRPDTRPLALSKFSVEVFRRWRIWDAIAPTISPIKHIHVSDQGRLAGASLSARRQGVHAFGYVSTHQAVADALLFALDVHRGSSAPEADTADGSELAARSIASDMLHTVARNRLQSVYVGDACASMEFTDGELSASRLDATLMVGADGARSALRKACGVGVKHWDHEQTALSFRCRFARPHQNRAFERFTQSGPLALLPLVDGAMGVIWTRTSDDAVDLLSVSAADFRAQFQRAVGWRLGSVLEIGPIERFPLHSSSAHQSVSERAVLVGSAAHALHPIGGQGFNLAVRDIFSLVETVVQARAQNRDIGAIDVLAAYAKSRQADQLRMARATRGLNALFSTTAPPVVAGRSIGMTLFDLLPVAKRRMLDIAMGHITR